MNPDKLAPGERAASTSNRNFEGRQGRGGRTHLVSPGVAAATAVAAKGGRVSRGVTRRTRIAVVGHGAYTLMGSGVLDARLDQARAVGADCISENTFLRRLGAMGELAKIERAISPDLMARQTGLDEATIATLMLFDVFETDS